MLPLTQGHLTLFETCPRKYQLVYFDSLSGPSSYDQHAKTQWGSQFHLLMQQQALNLPVARLAEANTEMSASLKALEQAAPDVFAHLPVSQLSDSVDSGDSDDPDRAFSQSEHRRTLALDDYLLTVIYDLLVISNQGAEGQTKTGQIYDWKTHQKPPPKRWLKSDWQTRLYLYVLCETTELTPQQISMTYWFVRLNSHSDDAASNKASDEKLTKPSAYLFAYSAQEHRQTHEDLQALTARLNQMRAAEFFPKVPVESEKCDRCVFNVRCDRTPPSHSSQDPLAQAPDRLLKAASQFTAETVEEVSL